MKPDFFMIAMYPAVSFKEEESLGRLLDVFESHEDFAPTHWGNSDTVRVEYNREEIMEKVVSEGSVSEVYLYRNKSVNYHGRFQVNLMYGSFLKFEFQKSIPKKQWPAFFELSDQIAQITKPSFGVTQIFWPLHYPWRTERERLQMWMELASQPVPVNFLDNGPAGVGARTYFSGPIADMIGKETLLNSPATVSELEWGGLRMDLLDDPLTSDSDALLDQWLRVMKHLEPSYVMAIPVFDKDRTDVDFSPNRVWREHLKK